MTEQPAIDATSATGRHAGSVDDPAAHPGTNTDTNPNTDEDTDTDLVREFDVTGPVRLILEAHSGEVAIETGSDRRVRVEAHTGGGRELLDQVRISLDGDVLRVIAPRAHRTWFSSSRDVDFRVLLPAASEVDAQTASGELTVVGDLADLDLRTASGEISVDSAHSLRIRGASGDIRVGSVSGDCRVTTASGDVEIGHVGGRAQVQSASGEVNLGEVVGDVEVSTASGGIEVASAGGQFRANSMSGDVLVRVLRGGRAQVNSASGDLELGVRDGVAAWLDLTTASGEVRTDLEDSGKPGPDTAVVEIRAVSASGDIRIRRA